MMADQALLNAVNKAIEALQEVKRELEREDTTPQEASVEAQPEPKIAPPFQTLAPEVELQEEPPSAPGPEKNIAPAQQSVPISAPAMTENVCPKCGKAFNPGSKFCMGCGAQLSAPAPAPAPVAPRGSFCKGCGAPLKSGDKFCMKCGARV